MLGNHIFRNGKYERHVIGRRHTALLLGGIHRAVVETILASYVALYIACVLEPANALSPPVKSFRFPAAANQIDGTDSIEDAVEQIAGRGVRTLEDRLAFEELP